MFRGHDIICFRFILRAGPWSGHCGVRVAGPGESCRRLPSIQTSTQQGSIVAGCLKAKFEFTSNYRLWSSKIAEISRTCVVAIQSCFSSHEQIVSAPRPLALARMQIILKLLTILMGRHSAAALNHCAPFTSRENKTSIISWKKENGRL